MRISLSLLSLALAASLASGSAAADDLTEDLTVSATFRSECFLLVSDIGGGEYGGLSAGTHGFSNGALLVQCNAGTAYSIAPGDGTNYGQAVGEPNKRALSDGAGNFIAYGLFKDPGATQAWDVGADLIEGVGTGEYQQLGVGYAFYDINKAPGGDYSDTVAVTLTF
ncbi:spore coat protein U domain-containing protein [Stenotrophomonas maltophilia]|uniref:spore coat protein U domain-containing protein n=1 Tax=Stenotrophomonas maltophilia TaxID=40324 RepID=UPI00209BAA18|nr:spore coat U domain-containing protein [Stenotrophomonas maltophilia]MCO7473025.1 spore coat U domain-containing protein [Stenotrophomonas maltophilia]